MNYPLKKTFHFKNKYINYSLSLILFFCLNAHVNVSANEGKPSLRSSSGVIKPPKQITQQFDPVDGSHIKLKQYIKNELLHEDSFIHAGTAYIRRGDLINITLAYRAKNKFNIMINHSANADYSMNGHLIKVYKID